MGAVPLKKNLLAAAGGAGAQTVNAPSVLADVWDILQPVIILLISTIGPLLVAWVGARLAMLLKIADDNQRKDLEQKLNAALHQSALNALKFATSKLGIPPVTGLDVRSPVIKEAVEYVRSKNPDAVDAFGLDDTSLAEIVMSKVPDVVSALAPTINGSEGLIRTALAKGRVSKSESK